MYRLILAPEIPRSLRMFTAPLRVHATHVFFQGNGILIEIDKNKSVPFVHSNLGKAIFLGGDLWEIPLRWHPFELSLQRPRETMVGTPQLSAMGIGFAQFGAAVQA